MQNTNPINIFSCSDGSEIADRLNFALLKNYRFDAEITAIQGSDSFPVLYAVFADNSGCIAFSAPAVSALVNMSLGQAEFDYEPLSAPTSATTAVIGKLSASMSEALGINFVQHITTECPPDFDTNSAFTFKIADQYDFWVYIPSCCPAHPEPDMPIELKAVIRQASIPLNQLAEWKVGSFLPLGIEKNAEIPILHNNKMMFKGIMGQKSRHIAVKITRKVS
ncbi:MAG: FliM/FliN family flagellar motor C-terminal domain-containing protein [Rhodospirillales bacterium]|nr:FliM/FliN family flagellar motor C-terminal domain-containing protein [Rhodospirillales bacterium]